jgi:hypothetical protein
VAHELAGQGHHVLDDLVGQDRPAGGDAAHQRHHGGVGGAGQFGHGQSADSAQAAGLPVSWNLRGSLVEGQRHQHFHGAGALGVAPEVAQFLQL